MHEKELVLNKEDTQNILSSVQLVRQLSDWITGRAHSMQTSLIGAAGLTNLDNTLLQEVTITANFPNATNREEISAAFNDIINRASQMANRKR